MADQSYSPSVKRVVSGVLITLLVLCGCKTPTTLSEEVPALLVDTNDASTKALQSALFEIFKRQVLIAPDALTNSSSLYIEQRQAGSLRNRPAQGRIMTAPLHLNLVTDESRCILIDQRSGARYVLPDTKCIATGSAR